MEHFHYQSEMSSEELIREMEVLLSKERAFNFNVAFDNMMAKDYHFTLVPRRQYLYVRGWGERAVITINARITEENGKAQVLFSIRPNRGIPLLAFIFPIIGIITLATQTTSEYTASGINGGAVVVGGFFLLALLGLMFFSHYAKSDFKNHFVNTLKLKQVW